MMSDEPSVGAVVTQGHHVWERLPDGSWRGCFYCDPKSADDIEWDWQTILCDINGESYEVIS
jgi:hypothetical protein